MGVLDEQTVAGKAHFSVAFRTSIAGTCLHIVGRTKGVEGSADCQRTKEIAVSTDGAGRSAESKAVWVDTGQADAETIIDGISGGTRQANGSVCGGAGSVGNAQAALECVICNARYARPCI